MGKLNNISNHAKIVLFFMTYFRTSTTPQVAPTEIPQVWVDGYLAANMHTPQAPASVDTIAGCAVMQSVLVDQSVSWADLFRAEPSDKLVTKAGTWLSRLHLAYGLPVIAEGYNPRAKQVEAAPELLETFLTIHGRPPRTSSYQVLGNFAIIPKRVIAQTLQNVKFASIFTSANFAHIVIDGDGRNTKESPGNLDNSDIAALELLTRDPGLKLAATSLKRLYSAANDALYSDQAKPAVFAQRQEFNLRQGGSPHTRTTPALRSLVAIVESGVEGEWEKLEAQGILLPAPAKERFLDDTTSRRRLN